MDESTTSTSLGRYRLLRKIGEGGMGEVWLAEDPRLQRQVALKVLPSRKQDDKEFLLRFEREARAAAALHHPHILPVHDFGQQQMPDGQTITYLVMSYVSGGSLASHLEAVARGQGTFTQEDALTYLSHAAEAIDYAHSHSIIHRDIKPANMLLRDDGWLLLTDFGIARILTDENSQTQSGVFLGSPTYMAPEQSQGHAVPASDIYSLAVVAYQFFTGRVPFQADNAFAMTFQHNFTPPPAPRSLNPALSTEFENALLRGLMKDPTQRPRSATAFVTGLRQALELAPVSATAAPAPVETGQGAPEITTPPRHSRRNLLIGLTGGVVLIGGGAAIYASLAASHPTTTKTPVPQIRATATPGTDTPIVVTQTLAQPVTSMSWSNKTNTLIVSNENGALLLDMPSGKGTQPPTQGVAQAFVSDFQYASNKSFFIPSGIKQFAWSPDGTMLAMENGVFDSSTSTDYYGAALFKTDFSGVVDNFNPKSFLVKQSMQGISWISNTVLASVSSTDKFDGCILNMWSIQQPAEQNATLTLKHSLNSFLSDLNALAFYGQNSLLAIVTEDGILVGTVDTNVNPMTWQQTGDPLTINSSNIGQAAWSPDGTYLAAVNASGSGTGGVAVWDASKEYQRVTPDLDSASLPGAISHISWSPTAPTPTLALGSSNGVVYLWKPGQPNPYRTLPGLAQEEKITALGWSFDGQWLAASYNDAASTLLFWRLS